ncbi:MAG: hypothetical protein M3217_05250 [Actinomycetota bacterium]|nr:hypothetical protein [Actinomycetota bacterium]
MRRRLVVLLALGLVLGALPGTGVAQASTGDGLVLAQEVGEGEEGSDIGGEESSQQQEGGTTEGDEGEDQESGGQDEPEAETGAGAGESEEAATESGPPWTYQMARMALAALVLLALAIAGAYYRFVVTRQRGAV